VAIVKGSGTKSGKMTHPLRTQLLLASHLLVVSLMACGNPSETKPAAPYGTWASPLTAARVTAGALRLDQIQLDGDAIYWLEGRASEGGRNVIVRRTPDGVTTDVTPAAFNVRSRVHEYGGAAYAVHRGTIYFSNFADQRLYRQAGGGAPEALTPAGYFYADCRVDDAHKRLLCVREDHTNSSAEPKNTIVALPLEGAKGAYGAKGAKGAGANGAGASGAGTVLVEGADFYSDPIVNPAGTSLAWLQWRHPNMPWDGTELWTAAIKSDGSLGARERVAGGADESIFQPEWSPDGTLYFVSDRTGWWNLYRRRGANTEPLHPMSAEFGKPQWGLSMVTYAFITANRIAATYVEEGRWKLALIETDPRKFEPIALSLQPIESIRADTRAIYFVGGSATEPEMIARVNLGAMEAEALRTSGEKIAAEWISVPETVTFRVTPDAGPEPHMGDPAAPRDVHAFYYAPKNPNVASPTDEKPPMLVLTHGGPTGATSAVLDPEVQFWTSRGFAVLDVNYSGSTGYGRPYRDRLKGQWGIVDVEDAVGGAQAMVALGKADPARLMIRGGSAGGYTTLAALTFHNTFKAGASYYGISDIEGLARDTHKFESRYLDTLIGPYPAAKDLYIKRSPIHFTDRLSCPLILFQGLEDKVVPPNQSAMMAEAVRKKGLPVAYVTFEGEQHGFRKAENIIRALEAELYFYGQVFRFAIADTIDPVKIDNPYR
jgi:dipeptidyl aminopeptidase/acylaminoacyl peptidase